MNNQDYENKKRECWEECAAEVAVETENLLCKAIAYSAFDRAYALGKEKESITQDEIEKASVEYADKIAKQYGFCNSEFVQEIMVAFEQGANFALGKQEKDVEETKAEGNVTISLHVAVIPRQEEFYMGVDASHEAYTIDIPKSMVPSNLLAVINGECKNKLVTNIAIMK